MTAVPPPKDIKPQSLPSAADEKLKQMREAYYRRVLDEAAARRKLIPRVIRSALHAGDMMTAATARKRERPRVADHVDDKKPRAPASSELPSRSRRPPI